MLQITEELVEKLRNKDEEAFQKIYNAYVKLIYHIAYSYTYNKEDAEDIVSEVFMKVMHSIHSYQENGKFKEWISMITRNVSLNFITRDKNKDIFVLSYYCCNLLRKNRCDTCVSHTSCKRSQKNVSKCCLTVPAKSSEHGRQSSGYPQSTGDTADEQGNKHR